MAPPIRIQLLGPVRALNENGPLALRGKTARTVLARLALSTGAVVSVDQLADALWDDDPPLEPTVSLRSIVSRLRAQLGRDAILTVGGGYRLDTTLVSVDLAEIDSAMKDGRLHDREPEELAALLGLWDGDALTDVAWTPAFEPERARIDELRSRLLDTCHDVMLRRGRAEETLADLERDAAAAPLRESTQLLLMRTLDACGRTADALRAGEAYRTRLIDETGLDPTAAYDALTRALLTPGDTPRDTEPGEKPAAVKARGSQTWIPPDTPLVGRESELGELARMAKHRRLVTITGPGGVGKTRLVTEFISRNDPATDAKVDMVALAALDRSTAVDAAVAAALGIEVSSTDTVRAITDHLSTRPSMLVLDNCEHVLPSTRALVQHMLQNVNDLRIITTSRRRLGLPDEAILDIGPLPLPATNAIDSAPMRLFMDRIERAAPKLAVSEKDRTVAADICRLVDGLPLALELTAARVPMFGFERLRQRLVDGLAVPGLQAHDDERRQATIDSTVEWSLALLSPEARSLFDDLSVFPSWFDLIGLEQVCANPEAVDAFSEIHDSSLVVIDHERPAYRLLEPVRQVARRQLEQHHRAEIDARYVTWVASIVDAADRNWLDDDRAVAQQLVVKHRADLRWLLNHLIDQGDADEHGRAANVLARTLVERTDIELIELCRVEVGPSLEGALARLILAWHHGDHDTSAALANRIGEELGLGPGHPLWGYYNWARIPVYLYQGDTAKLVEAAAIAVADDLVCASARSEAVALWACGLHYSGRREEAAAVMTDNEHILRLSGSGGFVAYARAELVGDHDPELAMEHLQAAARDAIDAHGPFTRRLTEVSRLVLLIAAHNSREAAHLALRLVPELIQAGTYPQAWTAMRHVAGLLGQIDAPAAGLLVLDSANADPSAPAVTAEAVQLEDQLRTKLEAQVAAIDINDRMPPSTLVPLWDNIEAILQQELAAPEKISEFNRDTT